MKYRKKPVVIEAEQWFPDKHVNGVCLGSCHRYFQNTGRDSAPHIHTLEGDMSVKPGDWIITGVQGERYACRPDIFEATYEPVQD